MVTNTCCQVHARGQTLAEIVSELADVVAARAAAGCSYGVVLLPEGLIEHIQEVLCARPGCHAWSRCMDLVHAVRDDACSCAMQ